MRESRRQIVEAGYDRLEDRYLEWTAQIAHDPRGRFVREFSNRLPEGARVLDLGCGAGLPSTRDLARRFDVVGVDISAAQVRSARENVPGATFIHADASELSFPPGRFEGVAALYAISHIPRENHAELISWIEGWLTPSGLVVATMGARDGPDWTGEWLDVPMFFSSYDAETNRELLRAAGFELLVDEILETHEPEGVVEFLWVVARKERPSRPS